LAKLQVDVQIAQQKAASQQQSDQMKLETDKKMSEQKLESQRRSDDQAAKAEKAKADAQPKKEPRKPRKISIKREGGKISEIAEA
jgi:hypothetical protein